MDVARVDEAGAGAWVGAEFLGEVGWAHDAEEAGHSLLLGGFVVGVEGAGEGFHGALVGEETGVEGGVE